METSNDDDEGDSSTPHATNGFMILSLLAILSCHKPTTSRSKLPQTKLTAAQSRQPDTTLKKKPGKKKKLYITFDDGPNKGTKNVLHIVQDEQIPVSFFIVAEHASASHSQSQLWDSLQAADNVALYNHSFCHAHCRYKHYYEHPDSVVSDFERASDSLQLSNRIGRTPGRNIWRTDSLHFTDLKSSTAAADALQQAGFTLLGWDVEWTFDHKTMSVTMTADSLIGTIRSAFARQNLKHVDHLVLLAHDQVYTKPDDSIQLRRFLQEIKLQDEYELALVTTYPGADKSSSDSLVPGISLR